MSSIFISLSAAIVLAALLWVLWGSVKVRMGIQKQKWQIPSPTIFTGWLFVAAIFLFIPIHHTHITSPNAFPVQNPQGLLLWIYTVAMSFYDAMRLFLFSLDKDVLEAAIEACPQNFQTYVYYYALFLYILAPSLSFINILSLFRNFTGLIRLRLCCLKPVLILSKLNKASVSIAGSRLKECKWYKPFSRPLIVFCDVFSQNEEETYELQLEAKKLNAICLKNDITSIRFPKIGMPVEIFLISDNESENVSHALKRSSEFQKSVRTVSIYVYSSDSASDSIIDGLNNGKKLVRRKFKRFINKHPQEALFQDTWLRKNGSMAGAFSVRRIDPVDTLVKNVLRHNAYSDYNAILSNVTDTLSITILGMGQYSTQYFKNAMWFYQKHGICLDFNIFDLGKKNGDPTARLGQSCPELISINPSLQDGDANYSIRVFHKIDCLSSDFNRVLFEEERSRFEKTNIVFVALGDDDLNIRAAQTAQALFAQMHISSNRTSKIPLIYAVVHDEQKAKNLNTPEPVSEEEKKIQLAQQLADGYHPIRYIDTLKEQYSYKCIKELRDLETQAFQYHLDWVRSESLLRQCYEAAANNAALQNIPPDHCTAFREQLDRELGKSGESISWGDSAYYTRNGVTDYSGRVCADEVQKTVEKYMRQSYYRQSSLAKAMHKKALESRAASNGCPAHSKLCPCAHCQSLRKTEHMRWNAYMRTLGYRLNTSTAAETKGKRFSVAKLHPDLVPWKKLPVREQFKD